MTNPIVHSFVCLNTSCELVRLIQYCEMTAAEYERATSRPFRCTCGGELFEIEHPELSDHVVDAFLSTAPPTDPARTARIRELFEKKRNPTKGDD